MGRRFLILFLMLGCVAISDVAGAAPVENAFLNIDGKIIKGNATLKGFQDEIVVQSFSYGVSQAGEWEEGEQITGRVTMFGDLTVTKVMDNGSPNLAHACASKHQFKKVVLSVLAGYSKYLEVTLEKVIFTGLQVEYKPGWTRPMETVTLSYRKATWRYGTATTSYNLATASD